MTPLSSRDHCVRVHMNGHLHSPSLPPPCDRFAIPFTMATTLGLSARALDLPITFDEAERGLVPPAGATHLFGASGALVSCTSKQKCECLPCIGQTELLTEAAAGLYSSDNA